VRGVRAPLDQALTFQDGQHAVHRLRLRDPAQHAEWLRAAREAATADGYPLVVNARIDVFLAAVRAGQGEGTQGALVPDALQRAHAYLAAGADCVFPIAVWEKPVVASFVADAGGPVNVLAFPRAPSPAELADLGVARVSYGTLLHRDAMDRLSQFLGSLAATLKR
jgi:2-methylisocitrate lyase-like PEP mutase family enzyme